MKDDKAFVAEISAILLRYRVNPAPENPVILYGASNFSRWTQVNEDMKPFECLVHAFGGSTDVELTKRYGKLVVPFAPRAVIVNSSQNDVVSYGDEQILKNKEILLSVLRSALPDALLVLLSVIRAPGFRTERVDALDRSAEALCETIGVRFCDISDISADAFFADSSHLNGEGYKALAEKLKNVLNT